MGLNRNAVFLGGPEQTVGTGAVLSAPLGTTLPTAIDAVLDPAFKNSGHVSKDGLEFSPEQSTSTIQDWNLEDVVELIEGFNSELNYGHLQTDEYALKDYFGADNVTATAATTTAGNRLAVTVRENDSPPEVRLFRMKSGKQRMLIVVPCATVRSNGSVKFVKSDAVIWPVRVKTYADELGNHGYIYTDDGQVLPVAPQGD